MNESKIKPKSQPVQKQSDHVIMQREDGKTANVHKSMIDDYRKGGYELTH